ncbi:MAG: hypothetical protein JO202_13135 [Ktedonobacteraceae bacterium]|nr:hypothetical protein [Ktedonobacteraceae bacterium]
MEDSQEFCWLGKAGSTHRLSWLWYDGGDGSSQPNTDGHVAISTTDRPAVLRWKPEKQGRPADDELQRSSRR